MIGSYPYVRFGSAFLNSKYDTANDFPTFHIFLNHHDWADCGVVYPASMHHRLGHVFLIVFRSFSISQNFLMFLFTLTVLPHMRP